MKSLLYGIARNIASFRYFNRTLMRWPKIFIEQSKKNIAEYGDNKVFQGHVESKPSWIPLNLRIIWQSASLSWSIAGIEFSTGLVGMYTYTIVERIVDDIVINLIKREEIPLKLMEEFVEYETSVKQGNLSGSGRVWDFFDRAYMSMDFNNPYMSMLEQLKTDDLITVDTYQRYVPKMQQLDRVLRANDAILYAVSNGDILHGDFEDSFYASRINKDNEMSLSKLLKLKVEQKNKGE